MSQLTIDSIQKEDSRELQLSDVQQDWRELDLPGLNLPHDVRLVSHEQFTSCPGFEVEHVPPGPAAGLFRLLPLLFHSVYALRLLRFTGPDGVLLLNGGGSLWLYVGFLNRCFLRKRTILCWDVFVETDSRWKRAIMRAAMVSFRLNVLWSRRQVKPHAKWLRLPEDRFIFLPFKANHSKRSTYDLPIGNYVFAGGNGKRDYRTLIEAVRDTRIPVIISASDPEVRRQIQQLPNVVALSATEPDFAKLQAGARFVVVPMMYTGLKGGGEANFCNGMWHGKPVIAADSIAANDYILEGTTGYVVPSGDVAALRRQLIALWEDPSLVARMGDAARCYVEKNFTHEAFIRRLLALATILGKSNTQVS